jgi:hypothetical protein
MAGPDRDGSGAARGRPAPTHAVVGDDGSETVPTVLRHQPPAVYAARSCLWCGQAFTLHRGGSRQTFCRAACRAAYHKAARQWCERAIAVGRLTVQDLRNGAAGACTLPERSERPLPLTDIGRGDPAALDTRLRFLVEVEHHTVAGLVKLGFIRRDECEELLAIIAGLKRLGWAPNISRVT